MVYLDRLILAADHNFIESADHCRVGRSGSIDHLQAGGSRRDQDQGIRGVDIERLSTELNHSAGSSGGSGRINLDISINGIGDIDHDQVGVIAIVEIAQVGGIGHTVGIDARPNFGKG